MKVVYIDGNDGLIKYLTVDHLNELHGADIQHLQVLKSAAGYFIGNLCKADWHPNFWEPLSRDSKYYWKTREDAECALVLGDYEVNY